MATTTTTVSGTQTIPEILEPYFTGAPATDTSAAVPGLLPSAQGLFSQDYATKFAPLQQAGLLGSGRIAGLSEAQQELGRQIQSMQTPGQFAQAGQYAGQAAAGLAGILGNPQLNAYQLGGPETFTPSVYQRYMDPYSQGVTDIAKRKAVEDAQRTQLAGNLAAGRKGSLGSSGSLMAGLERERQLGLQLGDIQSRGLESAYQNAQTQFERDRAAQMAVGQQNLQAMLGVQQLGAQQRLAAAQGLGSLAATSGQLGVAQQAADLDRMKALGAYGDLSRAYEQQRLDAQYQDMLRQIGYPEEQIGKMANILRGVPLGDTASTQATTTPPPSFASQLAGMGLSGLSLYNLLNK